MHHIAADLLRFEFEASDFTSPARMIMLFENAVQLHIYIDPMALTARIKPMHSAQPATQSPIPFAVLITLNLSTNAQRVNLVLIL